MKEIVRQNIAISEDEAKTIKPGGTRRTGTLNSYKVLAELLERYGKIKDEKETQSTDRGRRLMEAEAKGVRDSIQIVRRILLNEEDEDNE